VHGSMIYFGPVGEAAHGGHSSPGFNLLVGFVVLAITWVGYVRKEPPKRPTLWACIGVSGICVIFIYAGLAALLR